MKVKWLQEIKSVLFMGVAYALRTSQGDAGDARDLLQPKFGKGLASLLFAAGMHANAGTCRDALSVLVALMIVASMRAFRVRVVFDGCPIAGGGDIVYDFFESRHLPQQWLADYRENGLGRESINPSITIEATQCRSDGFYELTDGLTT
jgi:hypothetical protein